MENTGGKIKLGVCVMEKKVSSLTPILERLNSFGEFEIIYFGNKAIEEDPVDRWPICDCLIAFYSSGFPLEKAEEYEALRKPFLINSLEEQHFLHDRKEVYEILELAGIRVPRHAVVIREEADQEVDYFVEGEDFVEIKGERFSKPFVEKPVHGDDHKVRIYYPISAGGGMKELFRKVNNRSSEYRPDIICVRRDGSYIYEEFLATGGTDVKVYTVGEEYAHAEARKSPVVDGIVMRNHDGKEIRYPVLLSPMEKKIAAKVSSVFKQAVCGFDILRSKGKSYVCDVNGWSFVKNSHKYYDDAAHILRKMCLGDTSPYTVSTIPPSLPSTSGQEELRCVIAVIRHGDRTPKQKIKVKVTEEKLLNLILKYNGGRSRFEAKLKTAAQLQDLLDVMRSLVPRSEREGEEDNEHAKKLQQAKIVLEEGGYFSGINRKVQLKPLKWVKGDGEEERPVEALMVLKYGGVLTHAGRKQAEELGSYFRNHMYTGDDLLRLHSTYCHDLKIYSSDEGRVQMSAAAFAKGLLALEGELTPILVSLVSKDYSILDGLENASIEMGAAKARLKSLIMTGADDNSGKDSSDTPWMAEAAGLPPNALELLGKLEQITTKVTDQVEDLKSSAGTPCGEGLFLMCARWRKLQRDLYNNSKKEFDISKISDVYDSCKYDLLHNAHLKVGGLVELFKVAQVLADGVIPNEYGINPIQKLKIGSKVVRRLLSKILKDLGKSCKKPTELENYDAQSIAEEIGETSYTLDPKYANVKDPEKNVRTRLYFTSESHIHSLLNVLRYCNLKESIQGEDGLICHSGLQLLHRTKSLDYMSGVVLRMFENAEVPSEDPKRYRIELSFSSGADISPLEKDYSKAAWLHKEHTLPIMVPERLQEIGSHLTLEKMERMVDRALSEEQ